jgi:hypothetical protein
MKPLLVLRFPQINTFPEICTMNRSFDGTLDSSRCEEVLRGRTGRGHNRDVQLGPRQLVPATVLDAYVFRSCLRSRSRESNTKEFYSMKLKCFNFHDHEYKPSAYSNFTRPHSTGSVVKYHVCGMARCYGHWEF